MTNNQKQNNSFKTQPKPPSQKNLKPNGNSSQEVKKAVGESLQNSSEKSDAQNRQKGGQAEKSSSAKTESKTSQDKAELKEQKKETQPEKKSEAKELEEKKETGATKSKGQEQTQKTGSQESKDKSFQMKAQKTDMLVKLEGLFAFKMSMSTFYNEKGESVPVTALKYEPCRVSQIKSQKKESYDAVQVAFKAQKNKRCSKALVGHLKASGFKEGARFVREIRQKVPESLKHGQEVSIESLKKGDLVKITSLSKGRGFSGVMKRWNFAGGKASHGSKSHRRTGSIGQHTKPARVMPGRKMPGQYGFKPVSRLKVPVVDVFPEEGIIFVKGSVPGARNTLVSLRKMSSLSS